MVLKRRRGYNTYWYGWNGKKGCFLRIYRTAACLYFDHWSVSIRYGAMSPKIHWPRFYWTPQANHLLFGRGNITYHKDLKGLHSLLQK